jgi:hypothetical protein
LHNNIFDPLENLIGEFLEKAENSRTKAATAAYTDAAETVKNQIEQIKRDIQAEMDKKYEDQMKKFDEDHSNYDVILQRGHIGIPDDSHKVLSDFTLGKIDALEAIDTLPDHHKEMIISTLAADKEMNEQLAAHRHGFHYIKHTQGHDGITTDGKVYEVKNRKYKKKKDRMETCIIFDRVSPSTERKLKEGRPEIIFNVTDAHKVLVEMRVKFSDKLLNIYSKKVEDLKYSKTSGFSISFKDFKDDILEITHKSDDLSDYHIQKNFLDYVEANS